MKILLQVYFIDILIFISLDDWQNLINFRKHKLDFENGPQDSLVSIRKQISSIKVDSWSSIISFTISPRIKKKQGIINLHY